MCRILVAVNPVIPRGKLAKVFKTLSDGGNRDACGFAALKSDGRLVWGKVPLPCSVVGRAAALDERLYREIMEDTLYLMVHARKTTRGDPTDNANNHPFCYDGVCVIHNGSLTTPTEYYMEALELVGAETDSASLLVPLVRDRAESLLSRAKRGWKHLDGKASIAVIDAETMELLYTKNYKADIYVYVPESGDEIYMATSTETLFDGLGAEKAWELTEATLLWRNGRLVEATDGALVRPAYRPYGRGYSYSYRLGTL